MPLIEFLARNSTQTYGRTLTKEHLTTSEMRIKAHTKLHLCPCSCNLGKRLEQHRTTNGESTQFLKALFAKKFRNYVAYRVS